MRQTEIFAVGGIPSGCIKPMGDHSGGVAALNHRLQALILSGYRTEDRTSGRSATGFDPFRIQERRPPPR
jgi:hypothetical protein